MMPRHKRMFMVGGIVLGVGLAVAAVSLCFVPLRAAWELKHRRRELVAMLPA